MTLGWPKLSFYNFHLPTCIIPPRWIATYSWLRNDNDNNKENNATITITSTESNNKKHCHPMTIGINPNIYHINRIALKCCIASTTAANINITMTTTITNQYIITRYAITTDAINNRMIIKTMTTITTTVITIIIIIIITSKTTSSSPSSQQSNLSTWQPQSLAILHQQNDFKFSDAILGHETSVFTKFHDVQMFNPNTWNLDPAQTFSSSSESNWSVACA